MMTIEIEPPLRLVRRAPQPATSEHFDPHVMLAKARAGAYPAAAHHSQHRADEIAYWQQRCADEGLPFDEVPVQVTQQPQALVQAACEAWQMGGSAALGMWLGNHKEQTTKKRAFTTQEYGEWVRLVKEMEVADADAP